MPMTFLALTCGPALLSVALLHWPRRGGRAPARSRTGSRTAPTA
ncbi:hypothetical protein ABT160_13565 [Streptomyces sp. NPDC001941]